MQKSTNNISIIPEGEKSPALFLYVLFIYVFFLLDLKYFFTSLYIISDKNIEKDEIQK